MVHCYGILILGLFFTPDDPRQNNSASSRPEDKLLSIASTDPVGDDFSPEGLSCPKQGAGCHDQSIVVAPKATDCRREQRVRKSGDPSERPFPGHSTPQDNFIRVGSLPHPATFQDARYDLESSFWPGLSFFEHVPARTKIRIVTTLVFQGPQAAARVRHRHHIIIPSAMYRFCLYRFCQDCQLSPCCGKYR